MGAKIPLVDLKAQYQTIKPEIDAAMARIVANTSFILGKELSDFEAAFAAFCGAKHCIGVGSGTGAIHLALRAAGIGPGDEVITTPMSFIATAEPIWMVGARPVFADIDLASYNIDPRRVEEAITPKTKAILPVHLYGRPADMRPLLAIGGRYGIPVIEDAAQAHGASFAGQTVGSIGKLACFSFYPGKNLGAYGDGGAVTTNDDALATRVRMFRDHGRLSKYEHEFMGFGERLDALQAAILAVKLPHLAGWNARRRALAARYNSLLAGSGLVLPVDMPDLTSVYHIYALRTPHREALLAHLKANGVDAGIHYPIPLHMQPALSYLGYKAGDFPNAETAGRELLSLPIYAEMTEAQQDYVVDLIRQFKA
jgi:dTDP-4-amino-4,6-dideoxygalactose transaminase